VRGGAPGEAFRRSRRKSKRRSEGRRVWCLSVAGVYKRTLNRLESANQSQSSEKERGSKTQGQRIKDRKKTERAQRVNNPGKRRE